MANQRLIDSTVSLDLLKEASVAAIRHLLVDNYTYENELGDAFARGASSMNIDYRHLNTVLSVDTRQFIRNSSLLQHQWYMLAALLGVTARENGVPTSDVFHSLSFNAPMNRSSIANINVLHNQYRHVTRTSHMKDGVKIVDEVISFGDEPLPLIVDVRSLEEVRQTGIIPSAVIIPLNDLSTVLRNVRNAAFSVAHNVKTEDVNFHPILSNFFVPLIDVTVNRTIDGNTTHEECSYSLQGIRQRRLIFYCDTGFRSRIALHKAQRDWDEFNFTHLVRNRLWPKHSSGLQFAKTSKFSEKKNEDQENGYTQIVNNNNGKRSQLTRRELKYPHLSHFAAGIRGFISSLPLRVREDTASSIAEHLQLKILNNYWFKSSPLDPEKTINTSSEDTHIMRAVRSFYIENSVSINQCPLKNDRASALSREPDPSMKWQASRHSWRKVVREHKTSKLIKQKAEGKAFDCATQKSNKQVDNWVATLDCGHQISVHEIPVSWNQKYVEVDALNFSTEEWYTTMEGRGQARGLRVRCSECAALLPLHRFPPIAPPISFTEDIPSRTPKGLDVLVTPSSVKTLRLCHLRQLIGELQKQNSTHAGVLMDQISAEEIRLVSSLRNAATEEVSHIGNHDQIILMDNETKDDDESNSNDDFMESFFTTTHVDPLFLVQIDTEDIKNSFAKSDLSKSPSVHRYEYQEERTNFLRNSDNIFSMKSSVSAHQQHDLLLIRPHKYLRAFNSSLLAFSCTISAAALLLVSIQVLQRTTRCSR